MESLYGQGKNTVKFSKKVLSQGLSHKDFQAVNAGQSWICKALLLLFIAITGGVASILGGFAGGVISLYSVIETPVSSAFRGTLIIILVTIICATTQNLIKSISVFLVSFFLVSLGGAVLSVYGAIPSFTSFLMGMIVALAFIFGMSTISYFMNRFAIALTDILFTRSYLLKTVGLFLVVAGSGLGASSAMFGELQSADSSYFKEALQSSQATQITVVVLGVIYGAGLMWIGWLANVLRGTPWNYPGLNRLWALAAGSFLGKSFANLDLSNVNFRGANLANADLRARILYRTCLQGTKGLERARVDNQYLDLEYPKVQQLLTRGRSQGQDFRGLNLRGAYLQNADLRGLDFTDTNLTGADFRRADLRDSLLVRTQLADTDFQGVDLRNNILTDANLTEANCQDADMRDCLLVRAQVARANFARADLSGACIEDWSVSSKTCFTDVRCDYIYRRYQDGQKCDRYPVGRDFEPGEFATLFTTPEDIVELVFKGEFDYAALSLSLYKLQTEAPDLDIELKGIEHRDHLWVVKVKSGNETLNENLVEERLNSVYQTTSEGETIATTIKESIYRDYEDTRSRLAESEQLVRQLAGLSGDQAEALKALTKKSLGNNFFISGSTITNLAGSGQIEYKEAANRVRSLVTDASDSGSALQRLLLLLNRQNVATTTETQQELIHQILLSEAEKDPQFKQFLLQEGKQILESLPGEDISTAVRSAISQMSA